MTRFQRFVERHCGYESYCKMSGIDRQAVRNRFLIWDNDRKARNLTITADIVIGACMLLTAIAIVKVIFNL